MGTTWEEIEAGAITYIKNDTALEFDLRNRLPVFYNRMKAYMERAIGLLTPPALAFEVEDWTEPEFDDGIYTLTAPVNGDFTIQSGMTGFDICSIGIVRTDSFGAGEYEPVKLVSYDSTTGEITANGTYTAGTEIVIDCYKSGAFAKTLNYKVKEVLMFAIYDIWEHRFDNDVLQRVPKIKDKSFDTGSEAAQTNANTVRLKAIDAELYNRIKAYEQNREATEVLYRRSY